MAVRDYELDGFGVVNNAVYQNYLEHARHMFLESHGVKLTDLSTQGFSAIIARAELDYRDSLKSGDDFVVNLKLASLTKVELFSQRNPELAQKNAYFQCKGYRYQPQFFPDVLFCL